MEAQRNDRNQEVRDQGPLVVDFFKTLDPAREFTGTELNRMLKDQGNEVKIMTFGLIMRKLAELGGVVQVPESTKVRVNFEKLETVSSDSFDGAVKEKAETTSVDITSIMDAVKAKILETEKGSALTRSDLFGLLDECAQRLKGFILDVNQLSQMSASLVNDAFLSLEDRRKGVYRVLEGRASAA